MLYLNQMNKKNKGFSLIELMIVIDIIGILAVVGSSSYKSQIQRGLRADAQRTMMEIAAKQEQYMMNNQNYTWDLSVNGLNYTIPTKVAQNYNITVMQTWGVQPGFIVNAVAQGEMLDDGNLSLNSDGTKTPANKW